MLGVSAWGGQNPQVQRQGQETGAEDEEQDDGEPEAAPEEPEEEGEDEGPSWRDHLYWSDGLYLDSTWNNLRVKFAGDVQNDTAGFLNTESAEEAIGQPIEDGVEWRRVRLYTDGTFGTHFHFRFRWDFTASNPPSLQDAYFGIRKLPIPTLEIIAGRFKAPLGLEGYTGAPTTQRSWRGASPMRFFHSGTAASCSTAMHRDTRCDGRSASSSRRPRISA